MKSGSVKYRDRGKGALYHNEGQVRLEADGGFYIFLGCVTRKYSLPPLPWGVNISHFIEP
jgi:hypothetical protein